MLMLLTEFNQELYERTIRGEGRKEEHSRLSDLVLSLMKEGRMDNLKRAMEGNDFCDQLFQSHNL